MTLTQHLQVVGVLMFALFLLNFAVWKHYQWGEEIKRLTLLTRQVFIVHSFFIMLSILAFGVVSLMYPQALLEPSLLGRLVLAFLTMFWGCRFLMQQFVYDRALWRGKRFETFIHMTFSGVWLYFTIVYAAALARQWA
jgi:hypothetical protein